MDRMLLSRRGALAAIAGGLGALAGCLRDDEFLFGCTATGIPFTYLDLQRRRVDGVMIDIANAVARHAALLVRYEIDNFAGLVPSLIAHKIDGIAAAMLRTPARSRVVAFSDPVLSYAGAVAVRAADPVDYTNLQELESVRVGAQMGTRFIEQLAAVQPRSLAGYDGLSDALRDLANGRIDVVYGDEPILRQFLATDSGAALRLVHGFRSPTREELCLILRRDDPRMARINAAIAALKTTEIRALLVARGLV